MLKPELKKSAVDDSFVFQRRYDLSFALGGHDTDPLELSSADRTINCFSSRCAGIITLQKLIDAGFIDIDDPFRGELGYGLYELFTSLFVAFFESRRLFYA